MGDREERDFFGHGESPAQERVVFSEDGFSSQDPPLPSWAASTAPNARTNEPKKRQRQLDDDTHFHVTIKDFEANRDLLGDEPVITTPKGITIKPRTKAQNDVDDKLLVTASTTK